MPNKILIIGPSWVGDMIMAQALLRTLKQQQPEVQIDVLLPDWSRPILTRIPEVTETIRMPVGHGKLGLKTRYQLGKSLRNKGYTHCYVLTGSWKSALVPFFAKIPNRIGWLGEMRWGLLNDVRHLDKKQYPKMVQRYVALAYPKGAQLPANHELPHLTAPQESVDKTLQKYQLQLDSKPILALCPGAAYGSAKRWPWEYYAQLAQQKIEAGWRVWLFGSKDDKLVTDKIEAALTVQAPKNPAELNICENFAGQLDLFETVDLFSKASAVVTNDSGLMHMAAALDKPVVAIYGSTSPGFTPPLGKRSVILNKGNFLPIHLF